MNDALFHLRTNGPFGKFAITSAGDTTAANIAAYRVKTGKPVLST